jgi:hypothetical protein
VPEESRAPVICVLRLSSVVIAAPKHWPQIKKDPAFQQGPLKSGSPGRTGNRTYAQLIIKQYQKVKMKSGV